MGILSRFWQINAQWSTKHSCSYTFGKTNNRSTESHSAHGKSQLDWQSINSTFKAGFYVCYNAWKPIDYSPNKATTPRKLPKMVIFVVDFKHEHSLPINDKLSAQLNIENLLDVHYKTYSN